MDAVEFLMEEHRLIELALDALVRYAEGLARLVADPADLGAFVEFIRKFADGLHHRKEEDLLFASMLRHGFSSEAGPIAVMLSEHDEGRRLVGEMASVAQLPEPWSAEVRNRAASAALSYSSLLRGHIYKEDNVLYRMARMHLPQGAFEELTEQFAAFEREHAAESERLRALALRLAGKYAVKSPGGIPSSASSAHACACGGVPTAKEAGK